MQNSGYPADWIESLKSKNNIVDIVSKYVHVERKGRTFWACCPFHHEKTPSFAINEYEQYYHCFGCSESGDVIRFVEKIESCDFMEAVKILAENVGMEIPKWT
ncbi:MAG: CHC2 zinc finger domain-containing protein, partial [Clostridia bacterium]